VSCIRNLKNKIDKVVQSVIQSVRKRVRNENNKKKIKIAAEVLI